MVVVGSWDFLLGLSILEKNKSRVGIVQRKALNRNFEKPEILNIWEDMHICRGMLKTPPSDCRLTGLFWSYTL